MWFLKIIFSFCDCPSVIAVNVGDDTIQASGLHRPYVPNGLDLAHLLNSAKKKDFSTRGCRVELQRLPLGCAAWKWCLCWCHVYSLGRSLQTVIERWLQISRGANVSPGLSEWGRTLMNTFEPACPSLPGRSHWIKHSGFRSHFMSKSLIPFIFSCLWFFRWVLSGLVLDDLQGSFYFRSLWLNSWGTQWLTMGSTNANFILPHQVTEC